MSSNAKQILADVVSQRRNELAPEASEQDYFEVFSAEQILKNFELSYDELEAGIVDGEHDGGIDSIYTFINGELIQEDFESARKFGNNPKIDLIIIQSKTSGGFSEVPIEKLNGTVKNILDFAVEIETLTQYNESLLGAADRFRMAYRSLASRFPILSVKFFYAAQRADSEIHPNLESKKNDLIRTVQSLFDETNVDFEFLGAKELLAMARRNPSQTFELRVAKTLNGDNGYVFLCTLSDFDSFLRNGGEHLRSDLFEQNVRDFQGTTEVNNDIYKTLTDGGDVDFWWLNNGITVLGSRATVTGATVTIENPQIVNGLQTSSQIARFFDQGGEADDRMVMVKVVSSEDEDVRDRIIKATNSQNSVPLASLRATDKVQRDIEHALKGAGLYYDRRKNQYKNEGKPAGKIVSIPLLAQALMTLLLGQPDNARARPSSLIKDDEVYKSLFSDNHPLEAYIFSASTIKRVELALKRRGEFTARDRNNLRFYVLYWVASSAAKKTNICGKDLKKAYATGVSDAEIEIAIDLVNREFIDLGGTDQVAKGSMLKSRLEARLNDRIVSHFKSQSED